jgi:CheY-like chemotaxis protein
MVEEFEQQLSTGTGHILAVDDSQEILALEKRMLESLGYQVTVYSDPEEALETFQARPDDFDLLLTDMTMPGMTGVQLANEIFTIRPKMPIVLCTGFSELINEERAKALGLKGFIMKPVVKKDLALTIRKALANSQR